jgi:hypothetical protein
MVPGEFWECADAAGLPSVGAYVCVGVYETVVLAQGWWCPLQFKPESKKKKRSALSRFF